MRIVIESGTEIRKFTESFDDPGEALECVEGLIAWRRPNVVVHTEEGSILRVADLRSLAESVRCRDPWT